MEQSMAAVFCCVGARPPGGEEFREVGVLLWREVSAWRGGKSESRRIFVEAGIRLKVEKARV